MESFTLSGDECWSQLKPTLSIAVGIQRRIMCMESASVMSDDSECLLSVWSLILEPLLDILAANAVNIKKDLHYIDSAKFSALDTVPKCSELCYV